MLHGNNCFIECYVALHWQFQRITLYNCTNCLSECYVKLCNYLNTKKSTSTFVCVSMPTVTTNTLTNLNFHLQIANNVQWNLVERETKGSNLLLQNNRVSEFSVINQGENYYEGTKILFPVISDSDIFVFEITSFIWLYQKIIQKCIHYVLESTLIKDI